MGYSSSGTLVGIQRKGLESAIGPRLAALPNEGLAIAVAMEGQAMLGPFTAVSANDGGATSMIYAGLTP